MSHDPAAAPSPVAVRGTAIDELVHVVGQALDQLDQSGAERFCLRFRVGSDFFEEAAKLRAARVLWARLLEGRLASGETAAVRIEAYVPARTAAPGEEDEDLIRGTLAALSALVGGADAVDAGLLAGKLAGRVLEVLEHECGLDPGSDPLAGSHHLERLTAELEGRALEMIRRGGR